MGMLFNTDGTIRTLNRVNSAFKKKSFATLSSSPPGTLIHDLMNLGSGATGIFQMVCIPLRLDDYNSDVSTNWKNFLNLLDTTNQTVSGVTKTLSQFIGIELAKALQGQSPYNGVKGVEFFAVPGTTLQLTPGPPFQIFTDTATQKEKTMIVTIETATVQALMEARRRHREH
jgi:hypothetical protein